MYLFRRFPAFRRFPTFHPLPREAQELIQPGARSNYPSFTADFDILEKELMPTFRELDNEALRDQNLYRWMYVILIFGGGLATALAIVQLAFLNFVGFGIAEAVVTAIIGTVTALSRSFNYQERYLNARLATERLRNEYFMFLGHFDSYANDQDRIMQLRKRVIEIRKAVESSGSPR